MKHKVIFGLLRLLVYIKRFLWWVAPGVYKLLLWVFGPVYRIFAYFSYKISYFARKLGWGKDKGAWWFKRQFLFFVAFLAVIFVALPQTTAFSKVDSYLAGQKTIAFRLVNTQDGYQLEEVSAEPDMAQNHPDIIQRDIMAGVEPSMLVNSQSREQNYIGPVAGGTAVLKPILLPGAKTTGARTKAVEYIIQPGDSISSIAYQYGVSVETVLWENGLTLRSVLRLGGKLIIPPTTGIFHVIKKGDNLTKIAKQYSAKSEDIVAFNNLKADGTDLVVGEKIMVPNGIKPNTAVAVRTTQTATSVARPASSRQSPGTSGFVWPSAARIITQYYGWVHHGLDIAGGGMGTAIYAAKGGTVEISQCGWNSGYGCYIVINHGGGVKTLYGHNSKLLVSKGDYVETGQTISLMGNTGKVRGVTGIHLHFEVQVNGVRMNPLSYVR